jgi:hypothetical protein
MLSLIVCFCLPVMLCLTLFSLCFTQSQVGSSGNACDLQAGGAGSTLGRDTDFSEVSVVFLSLFMLMTGKYLRLGHDRFFSRYFQFVFQ